VLYKSIHDKDGQINYKQLQAIFVKYSLKYMCQVHRNVFFIFILVSYNFEKEHLMTPKMSCGVIIK